MIDLERRITEREWEVGALMPSESELAAYYNVSRVTVRQSLERLVQKGVIRKQRGQGTFLASIPSSNRELDVSLPPEVHTKLMHFGMQVKARIISIEEIFDATIAKQLHIEKSEPIVQITRLFSSENIPYSLNQSWLPAKFVPDILKKGLINNSIAQTLEIRYKMAPASSDNWIEATLAPKQITDHLQLPEETVLMRITTVEKTANQSILEFAQTYWIKEKVRFHFSKYHAEPQPTE